MHLGWTIVDTESTDLAKQLLDHRVARNADTSHDLYAAVGDEEQGFGYCHLRHRTFCRRQIAPVQDVGAPVDRQLCLLQCDHVLREHEAHPLVVDEELAERLTAAGIGSGDFFCAPSAAEPA